MSRVRLGGPSLKRTRIASPKANGRTNTGISQTDGPRLQTGLQRLCGLAREANSQAMTVRACVYPYCLRVPIHCLYPSFAFSHVQSGTLDTSLSQHTYNLYTTLVLNIQRNAINRTKSWQFSKTPELDCHW